MKRTIGGILVFAVMVVILIGLLQLMNWVPSAVQEGTFERFGSLDEVRTKLRIKPLLTPVYYPRSIHWPPSLIAAQLRPYHAVVMEFMKNDGDGTGLVITQTERTFPPLHEKLRLSVIRERVSYPFKGRVALLQVGACESGDTCSRIDWDEGMYHVVLTMAASPVDLIRIAESMVVDEADKVRDGDVLNR